VTTTVWELTLENLILRLDTKLQFCLRYSLGGSETLLAERATLASSHP